MKVQTSHELCTEDDKVVEPTVWLQTASHYIGQFAGIEDYLGTPSIKLVNCTGGDCGDSCTMYIPFKNAGDLVFRTDHPFAHKAADADSSEHGVPAVEEVSVTKRTPPADDATTRQALNVMRDLFFAACNSEGLPTDLASFVQQAVVMNSLPILLAARAAVTTYRNSLDLDEIPF